MRDFTLRFCFLFFLAAGCAPDERSVLKACAPQSSQPCVCSGGGQGTQTCAADGTAWGSCDGCGDAGVIPTCNLPATRCGGLCTALSTDANNCGACGVRCPRTAICSMGVCECPSGQDRCGDNCVDLTTDDTNCGACAKACEGNTSCNKGYCVWRGTNIQHVVVIVQENHTFDSYFGTYCTAPAYSNPACTRGRACCESAPPADPRGNTPLVLDDASNYAADHDHGYQCEVCQINGGQMDGFTGGGCVNDVGFLAGIVTNNCSSPQNYQITDDPALMSTYWSYADDYALADRYFQSIAGSTSGNDMYFAVSHFEFSDNDLVPAARGAGCSTSASPVAGDSLPGRTTIADLLVDNHFTFKAYADGYADAYNAWPSCPPPGGVCREVTFLTVRACKYDPSDVPFEYYPRFTDNPTYMKDLSDYFADVQTGTLPSFSFVKYRTSGNEHPAWSYISDGAANVAKVVDAILGSPLYQSNTLVLLTWDEGGGFFDHVAPPPSVETFGPDAKNGLAGTPVPYGTRVPLLAIGAFAKKGAISHVPMEHSSIVKFLEWNFLGPTGEGAIHATQPAARDAAVHNIGSLLDSVLVGTPVP